MTSTPRTVILYHGNCPDGFGGAYAAWKKFGDTAEYTPVKHGHPAPEGLEGAHLYLVDFTYPLEIMQKLVSESASVTVLDHHAGIQDVVEQMPEYVFDNDRSGATISWSYFHPDEPVPSLLRYVEDGDLYRFVLPESRTLLDYIYTQPFTFAMWDALRTELEDPAQFAQALETGRAYIERYNALLEQIVDAAELVEFEGYTVYLASCSRAFASDAGNRLCRKQAPLALIATVRPDGLRVSLRGDGSVDTSAISRKYGGNGHKSASAFALPFGTHIPWVPATPNE